MKFSDQLGRELNFEEVPLKVISLVPSITEFLYNIGIEPIAQTLFCVKPENQFKKSTKIGGTKKLKVQKIIDLAPDLIIANKEENLQDEIELLSNNCSTYISDISTIKDACKMMKDIGSILNKEKEVDQILADIDHEIENSKHWGGSSYLYLIWNDPYFVAGTDTFIHDMLRVNSWENFAPNIRYPEMSDEKIRELAPEYIFLSSEPFPFKEEHKTEIQAKFPDSKVCLIDGEMVSWYGSRIPLGLRYLCKKEFLST